MKKLLLVCSLLISLDSIFAQPSENLRASGSWLGRLSVQTFSLRLVFNCSIRNDSLIVLMDSPDQGAKGIPMEKAYIIGDSLIIEAPKMNAKYQGKLQEGDSVILGIWRQNGKQYPLDIHKTLTAFEIKRPQEPKPPFNYLTKEVIFLNKKDNVMLSGTLTIPKGKGSFPAIILISGSGPQNRNEEILGHKPFLVLADHLTNNSFAVLRYDDRGVEKSTGDFSTANSFDFASDAEAALNFLKMQDNINIRQIGIAGHSEGGLIAPIIASKRNDVAFIIMLAGPGCTGEEILLAQSRLISKVQGVTDEEIEKNSALSKLIYEAIKTEKDSIQLAIKIKAIMESALEKETSLSEQQKIAAQNQITNTLKSVTTNWFRTFIIFNPRSYLMRVQCPVLALNGEKDLQVPAKENLQSIEKCLKTYNNKKNKIVELKNLNHLFQNCTTGSPAEYNTIEETFSIDALNMITEWLQKTL